MCGLITLKCRKKQQLSYFWFISSISQHIHCKVDVLYCIAEFCECGAFISRRLHCPYRQLQILVSGAILLLFLPYTWAPLSKDVFECLYFVSLLHALIPSLYHSYESQCHMPYHCSPVYMNHPPFNSRRNNVVWCVDLVEFAQFIQFCHQCIIVKIVEQRVPQKRGNLGIYNYSVKYPTIVSPIDIISVLQNKESKVKVWVSIGLYHQSWWLVVT